LLESSVNNQLLNTIESNIDNNDTPLETVTNEVIETIEKTEIDTASIETLMRQIDPRLMDND